jgi:prepilin-type N-terminal cleavage/methylation domain-containing protein
MTERRNHDINGQGEAGFSLVETLMAVVISSIVLLGLYLIYDVNQATFIRGEQQTERELRMAGNDPSGALAVAGTGILTADSTEVVFVADIDSDGTTEKVGYICREGGGTLCTSQDPAEIRRETCNWDVIATAWVGCTGYRELATRATALTFAFYDGGGNLLPTPVPVGSLDAIRRIAVAITTADTVTGTVPQPFTLQADIRPRNLGL